MRSVEEIVAEVLGLTPEEITDQSERDEITAWDSFSHVMLLSQIETEMDISFSIEEFAEIKTVQQLKEQITVKKSF